MLSILDAFEVKYGTVPDVVISGFHLMEEVKKNYNDLVLGMESRQRRSC